MTTNLFFQIISLRYIWIGLSRGVLQSFKKMGFVPLYSCNTDQYSNITTTPFHSHFLLPIICKEFYLQWDLSLNLSATERDFKIENLEIFNTHVKLHFFITNFYRKGKIGTSCLGTSMVTSMLFQVLSSDLKGLSPRSPKLSFSVIVKGKHK